jgi:hypothetical protein
MLQAQEFTDVYASTISADPGIAVQPDRALLGGTHAASRASGCGWACRLFHRFNRSHGGFGHASDGHLVAGHRGAASDGSPAHADLLGLTKIIPTGLAGIATGHGQELQPRFEATFPRCPQRF